MLKKNKFYILEKSKHITSMVIWFSNLNLTEDLSKKLDILKEKFDLFFVFPQSSSGILDLEKFSSLHLATGYVISENEDPCQTMIWTLKYLREFRTAQYLGYYLGTNDCLTFETDKLEDLEKVANSTILNIGVMKYTRQSWENMEKISKKPDKKDLLLSLKYLGGTDPKGMYSTHTCTSEFVYLRCWIIDKINEFLDGNADYTLTPGYLFLDSFRDQWIGDFLASWVKKTDQEEKIFLNMNLKDVKA